MIKHLAIIALSVGFLASCERSARNIEVQPINPNVRGEGHGGDTLSKTGVLALTVSGLPESATTADIKISIDDNVETRTISLSSGSGTTRVNSLETGEKTIFVAVTIDKKYFKGKTTTMISSSSTSEVSVKLLPDSNNKVPGDDSEPRRDRQRDGSDESDLRIGIQIDKDRPNNGNGNNNSNNNGNGGTSWDGKSFKGNSIFSVEPVK